MSKIYCGAGKIPKNKEKGTMKQCAERNQIRLFGLYKVDPQLLAGKPKTETKKVNSQTVRQMIVKLKARFDRLKEELEEKEDAKEKKEIKKQIEETKKLYTENVLLFKRMNQEDEKKTDKKATMKDIDNILNSVKKDIDIKKTHLFVGGELVSSQVTMKKIKEDVKENFDKPKKDIKGYIIKLRLDKNDESPLIINCTQVTITPNLFIGNENGDGFQTFVFSKDELLKYGWKKEYIKKIIDAIKNKSVSLEPNRIDISDIL
jgi:hypothetical protein